MLKSNKGFSLVELMIVVGIIGILSAVAIPEFVRFQERARQTEAKSNLAGLYMAEKQFFLEHNTYYGNFDVIGFNVEGSVGYNIGFRHPGKPIPGINPGHAGCHQTCNGATQVASCEKGYATWTCNMNNGGYSHVTAAVTPSNTGYVAAAISKLNPDAASAVEYDQWTIDQNKNLVNINPGL